MTDFTPNYNFLLPNFDQRFWHDEMRRILKGFDSILAKYVALGNVKGVWANGTSYSIGDVLIDEDVGNLYECAVNHVSANTGTFADERATRTSYWINASVTNRFRGSWTTGTAYRAGDFIVSGNKYAVATQLFTSGATFADDEAAGKFYTLIDLAAIPASAVPVPNVSTAGYIVRQNSAGDGYEVVPISTIQAALSLGALAFLSNVTAGIINSGLAVAGSTIIADGSGGAAWGSGTNPAAIAKAWARFTVVAGVVTVDASFNITSIVQNGSGRYDVTFTNNLADKNFVVAVGSSGGYAENSTLTGYGYIPNARLHAASGFSLFIGNPVAGTNTNPTPVTDGVFSFVVFR